MQDLVGALLVDSAEINFTYTDATPSITAALINASITFARLQNFDALSVLGRAANSAGVSDEIAAGANDRLLRRTGDALNFGQLTAGMFPNTVVPDSALSSNVPLKNAATTFTATPLLLSPASGTASFEVQSNDTSNALFRIRSNAAGRAYVGAPGANNGLITGSVVGDLGIRVDSGSLLVSCDDGSTIHWKVSTAANISTIPIRLMGYTVATLPAGTVGDTAYVTDATAPTYLGALTGGGAVVAPVFYNGAAWVSG